MCGTVEIYDEFTIKNYCCLKLELCKIFEQFSRLKLICMLIINTSITITYTAIGET